MVDEHMHSRKHTLLFVMSLPKALHTCLIISQAFRTMHQCQHAPSTWELVGVAQHSRSFYTGLQYRKEADTVVEVAAMLT